MKYLREHVFTVIVPFIVLLVALTTGYWFNGQVNADSRAPMASALDAMPASVTSASVTDWALIRGGAGLEDAALRDLATGSVLATSTEQMKELFGWPVADLEWEAFGQTPTGAVVVARLSSSNLVDEVEGGLRRLGYQRRGAVWTLNDVGRAKVGPKLAQALGSVAVVARERLVVAASSVREVKFALAPIEHDARSLLDRRPVADLASVLPEAVTVLMQTGSVACASAALQDDPQVQAQAAAAIARAGELVRPTFAARALTDDGRRQQIRFAAAFDSAPIAASQAQVRGALAVGPFIGRSGQIEDSLRLASASSTGSVSTLRFALDPDRGAYLSGQGPLLFAACP